jgi:polyferredoxin
LLALLGGLVAAAGGASPVNALIAGAFAVAALAAAGAAIRWWGALCAWSWVIAQLIERAIKALYDARRAPTTPEQIAGIVTVAVALALVFVVVRQREGESPPAARERSTAAGGLGPQA